MPKLSLNGRGHGYIKSPIGNVSMSGSRESLAGQQAVAEPPAPSKKKKTSAAGPVRITIPKIDLRTFTLRLRGTSPLVTHKWSEKAIKMMLDKQTGAAAQKKSAKDPHDDYLESLYIIEKNKDGTPKVCGFPSCGFKQAAVDACSSVQNVTKVEARGAFHVIGDLVRIESPDGPRMRQDMVRVGMGTADIRFRGEFPTWAVELTIRYNANVLTVEEIVNLFNVAGFAVGVGEHRPQCNGSWGMFEVEA